MKAATKPKPTFQDRVYKALSKLPKGKITTYKRLAALAGNPRASRAVGNAMAHNTHFQTIHCFKVVHEDGRVGNYSRKNVSKATLLKKEGAEILKGRVTNLDDIVYPKKTH